MAEYFVAYEHILNNHDLLSLGNGNDCRNIFVTDGRGGCVLDDDSCYRRNPSPFLLFTQVRQKSGFAC